MSCAEWKPLLAARLYDEIDAADLRRLTEHLEGCAECRADADRLDAARKALAAGAPDVPSAPRLLVLAPRATGRAAWAFAAGVLCAVLLGGGALAGYRAGSNRARAEAEPAAPSEAALREEIGRRLDALEAKLDRRAPENEPPLTAKDLREAMDRLERRTASNRAADLDYVLTRLAASEQRTGLETREALRYVALASNPAFTAK